MASMTLSIFCFKFEFSQCCASCSGSSLSDWLVDSVGFEPCDELTSGSVAVSSWSLEGLFWVGCAELPILN